MCYFTLDWIRGPPVQHHLHPKVSQAMHLTLEVPTPESVVCGWRQARHERFTNKQRQGGRIASSDLLQTLGHLPMPLLDILYTFDLHWLVDLWISPLSNATVLVHLMLSA